MAVEIWNDMFAEARAGGVEWYVGFLMAHAPATLKIWYERAFGFINQQSPENIAYLLGGLPDGAQVLDDGCISYPTGTRKYLMAKRL